MNTDNRLQNQPDRTDRPDYGDRRAMRRERHLSARRRRRFLLLAVLILFVAGAAGAVAFKRFLSGRTGPDAVTYRVTLPEGMRNTLVASRISEATEDSITVDEFEDAVLNGTYRYRFLKDTNGNLEGFLFPDTYEVTSETAAGDFIDVMLQQYERMTSGLDWSRADELGLSEYEILIVASIIEREVKLDEERPLVASVIYNRLRQGMRLQLCSTVEYALGYNKEVLTTSDTRIDSPYNTYRIDGLPPGPISNPGIKAIEAALHPADTDYLFFVLTGRDGKHSFASSLDEFNRLVEEANSR